MNIKTSYRFYFLIGCFLLLSQSMWTQSQTDSILAAANKQIHKDPNLAIEMAKEILADSDATIDLQVNALIIISTAYSSKREYEKSLEYSLNTITLLPKITDEHLKIKVLNRIGAQYQELNVYDKAVNYLDEASKLVKNLPENVEKLKALGFNNLVRGFVYREQMSCEIALDYFNNSIEAYRKIAAETNVNSNLSTAYYNIGNCFLTINKIDSAKESFLQSITYAKKNNAKSLIAFANKGLASVYTTEGDTQKAINVLQEALRNSEEVGDKILNRSIFRALATNYLIENDIKNYSFYQDKNIAINNEIIKTERKTINSSIENIMDVNSKKSNNSQTRNLIFQGIIIFLILVVTGLILRSIYTSSKTLKLLKMELKL